ncbi:MAG TPA: zinc-dependent metalloprotease [Actinomycetota bacterium]|nr:zinc-dependent metalloprotease [Actinomycetota bacterium]
MSDQGSSGFGFPFGMDPESLRDAPLFREMQRVMSSSSGPVNWELARQVAVASAAEAGDDHDATDEERHGFEEAVRVAELHVARFTGLDPPIDVADVRAVRRAEWIGANAENLAGLLEPAARRIGESMDLAQHGSMPPEMQAMSGMLAQISPLLMGAQVGQVLGFLAQRVLGQYDVAVPRSGPGAVMFVVPNVRRFETDWSLDPTDFRTFVALHEVTHRFEFAQPWARTRFAELLDDFLSTLRFDMEGLRSRLATIDASDPETLQQMLQSDEGLFGAELDDEQRLKLGRIQAFMSAAEGYGDHVMHTLGAELLPSYGRIEEAMRRYREGEAGDPVFERLLGVEMKREQYEAGRAFCDTVVSLTDEATLSRMWESPDAMPSLPEVAEPRLWLARTV